MDTIGPDELFILPDVQDNIIFHKKAQSEDSLLVIVAEDELNDHLLTLLGKICDASGYNFDKKTSILVIEQFRQVSISQLFEIGSTDIIISFGLHEAILTTQFHKLKYSWISFDRNNILFADPLSLIDTNKNLKIQLWNNLKQKFNG